MNDDFAKRSPSNHLLGRLGAYKEVYVEGTNLVHIARRERLGIGAGDQFIRGYHARLKGAGGRSDFESALFQLDLVR